MKTWPSGFSRTTLGGLLLCLAALTLASAQVPVRRFQLVEPTRVAPGVELFHLADPEFLDPPGPLSALMLRLDPEQCDLRLALAHDRVGAGAEPVAGIAKRQGAVAAVNAGFFDVETGVPVGLLKVDGRIVSTSARPRGAVGIVRAPPEPFRLVFDRVRASLSKPGGADAAQRVTYQTLLGTSPDVWERASDIVGGAGLLLRDGDPLEDWSDERFRAGFDTERHPRTVVGADRFGRVWLITVDGRQEEHSLGMAFAELQGLLVALGLTDALNLDGGGSTTMVVKGEVVNRPSDETGPRPVSDALLVMQRGSR